jgi:hypothetical protein
MICTNVTKIGILKRRRSMKEYVSADQVYDLIQKRIEFLRCTYETIASHVIEQDGRLEASANVRYGNRYYWVHDVNEEGKRVSKREYLRKNDLRIATRIAQKNYEDLIKIAIVSEIKVLKEVEAFSNTAEQTYELLPEARKAIVDPGELSTDAYVRKWISEEYTGLEFDKGDNTSFYAKNGIRVRSKSEVLIANALVDYKVPFKYECPLKVGGFYKYPDFTVLNVKTRKAFYWEHFGIMDDAGYVNSMMEKYRLYEKMGLVLGKDYIVTFESRHVPLSTQSVENIIKRYLM